PVDGSGDCPPWMASVPSPARLFSLFMCDVLSARGSLHPAAQVVEQVDAGDQAEEAFAVHDDGDMAAVEYRQQRFDRRAHVDLVQLADHRGGDRVAEARLVAIDV